MARLRIEVNTFVAVVIAMYGVELSAQSSPELYGMTKGEAIEVCTPQGQREYLVWFAINSLNNFRAF